MQISPNSCACKHPKTLKGLGFWDSLLSTVGQLMNGGGGGGGGAMPQSGTNVSTSVSPNIQVSPQISPVFQQQFQPSNSPISAGTSQSAPFTAHPDPSYNAGGGGDFPAPISSPGIVSPQVPQVSTAPIDWNKYITYGAIGLGAIVLIKLLRGKNTPVRTRYIRRSPRRGARTRRYVVGKR